MNGPQIDHYFVRKNNNILMGSIPPLKAFYDSNFMGFMQKILELWINIR
jgi:hypothetical protein